jgi:hypothetical protein
MLETMYESGGIGLGCNPGGCARALDRDGHFRERNQPLVLVNPEIVWTSESRKLNEEGCLSVPGVYDRVERFESVHVRVRDLDGKERTMEARRRDGYLHPARDGPLAGQGVCGIPLACSNATGSRKKCAKPSVRTRIETGFCRAPPNLPASLWLPCMRRATILHSY